MHRFLIIILSLILGLLLVVLGFVIVNKDRRGAVLQTSPIVAQNFGGDFTLTNHKGEQVTQENFKDKWRLIYFGFTYCPAICPTELQKITQVLDGLGNIGKSIIPIFITVDPERDTVNIMKNYVSLFHDAFIGLTGTPQQIKTVKDAYKIYAAKVQDDTMNDYTVDHSSYIYFMNPNNDLVRIFKIDDTAQDMIDFIKPYQAGFVK